MKKNDIRRFTSLPYLLKNIYIEAIIVMTIPTDNVNNNSEKGSGPPPPVDIYRDTYVRYMGYANELGEAFRPNFPKMVLPSYGVSFTYVFLDAYDKAGKANEKTNGDNMAIAEAAVDTLLWQSFASVIIPGFVIHKLVDISTAGTKKMPKLPPVLKRWGPTAVGLLAIPLIIHPIDHFVDWTMDRSIRPLFKKWRGTDDE